MRGRLTSDFSWEKVQECGLVRGNTKLRDYDKFLAYFGGGVTRAFVVRMGAQNVNVSWGVEPQLSDTTFEKLTKAVRRLAEGGIALPNRLGSFLEWWE